jgi:hypothetical protein
MPSKVETQLGRVLEVELADDHAHECAQDHDEGRDFALDAPAEHRNSELGPHLAHGAPGYPVPDMSVANFALSGIPILVAQAGAAILVSALYYVARVALMLQTLTHLAQMVKRDDVAHGDIPERPAGTSQPVVPPQFVPRVKLSRLFHYLIVWCAGVWHIAPERPELVGRWYLLSAGVRAHLASTGCSRLSSSHEPRPGEGKM